MGPLTGPMKKSSRSETVFDLAPMENESPFGESTPLGFNPFRLWTTLQPSIRLSDHATQFIAEPNSKLRDRVKAAKLPKSEFFRVDIGDGLELDAWRILPPDLDPTKKYPLTIRIKSSACSY